MSHQTCLFRDVAFWRELRAELHAWPRERPIRVWSAACSTGEEVQSLAMVLLEAGLDFTIWASDKAPEVVAIAIELLDGPLPLDHWTVERVTGSDALAIDPVGHIGRVHFTLHDLVADERPPELQGPFDIVLARNFLAYVDPDARQEAWWTLQSCSSRLRPGAMELALLRRSA